MASKKNAVPTAPLKILFVSSEVDGLVKTGGLADVAKSLPAALKEMGHDVRIVMPFYQTLTGRDQAVSLLTTELYVEPQPAAVGYQIMQLVHGFLETNVRST